MEIAKGARPLTEAERRRLLALIFGNRKLKDQNGGGRTK